MLSTMTRAKFELRRVVLSGPEQLERAVRVLQGAPIDPDKPLEFLVREEVKARKPDQNAAMWAGPLADIAEQVWVDKRQYRAEVWHELFKAKYLPEDYDAELCIREDYAKWAVGFDGGRLLIASTKDLTVKGFAQYMTQIEAFGANQGVEFHVSPNQIIGIK